MTFFRLLFAGLLLTACNNTAEKEKRNPAAPQSLEPFADSLVRLNKHALPNLDRAAAFYQRLVPADSTLADSAAVLLLHYVNTALDSINERLLKDTTDYADLVYGTGRPVPEKQKQFVQQLQAQHVVLQGDGEGGVYALPDYAWVNRVMQPKTSGAVDAYLALLTRHETAPPMLDAGVAIEVRELVDRLVEAENLTAQKLPAGFAENVQEMNELYTALLLFGSDNTPMLDDESLAFTQPFTDALHYLTSNYPRSRAAATVNQWQAVVKTKDRKKVDEWRRQYQGYE